MVANHVDDLNRVVKDFMEYDEAIIGDFRTVTDFCFPLVSPGDPIDKVNLHRKLRQNEEILDFSNAEPPS